MWATLFGLLLWPALFAPVPDALRRYPAPAGASRHALHTGIDLTWRPAKRSARAPCAALPRPRAPYPDVLTLS